MNMWGIITPIFYWWELVTWVVLFVSNLVFINIQNCTLNKLFDPGYNSTSRSLM